MPIPPPRPDPSRLSRSSSRTVTSFIARRVAIASPQSGMVASSWKSSRTGRDVPQPRRAIPRPHRDLIPVTDDPEPILIIKDSDGVESIAPSVVMSSRHSPTVGLLTAPLEIWLSCSGATSRSTILARGPDAGDPARALGPFAGPLRWATLSAFHHDRLGPALDRGCKDGAFLLSCPRSRKSISKRCWRQ